jgi:hypothetical protein
MITAKYNNNMKTIKQQIVKGPPSEYGHDAEFVMDSLFNRECLNKNIEDAFNRRNFHYWIASIPGKERPKRLMEIAPKLTDKEFWFLVRKLWTADSSGGNCDLAELLQLLKCDREHREHLMLPHEHDMLSSLDSTLTVYRGSKSGKVPQWSWTLDENIARKRACDVAGETGGIIMQGKCQKTDVIAFFQAGGLNELEIVIAPENVIDLEIRQASPLFSEKESGMPESSLYNHELTYIKPLKENLQRREEENARKLMVSPKNWINKIKTTETISSSVSDRLIKYSRACLDENTDIFWDLESESKTNALFAAHESAHLILSDIFGWTPKLATIDTDLLMEGTGGRFQVDKTEFDGSTSEINQAQLKEYYKKWILVMLAGPACDALMFSNGEFLDVTLPGCDTEQAYYFSAKCHTKTEEIYSNLAESFDLACSIVSANQLEVYCLAKLILKHQTLNSHNLEEIFKEFEYSREKRWKSCKRT